jgi:DNA-binding transcriptional regulator YiaG
MNGRELRSLRERLKMTATQAAAKVSVSERTWQRWEESPEKPLSPSKSELVRLKLINKR